MPRPALAFPLLAALALALNGCSALRNDPAPDAEHRLAVALDALEAGDFDAARAELLALHTTHPHAPVGRRAALALATARLDPLNPERDLADGADWLRRYLDAGPADGLSTTLARTLYRLADELGAASLEAPPLPERVVLLEDERDDLIRRIETLERELERIRRLLRP